MTSKQTRIPCAIAFTVLIAFASPANAAKISNQDQDRLSAIGYADALIEACPKRFKLTAGAEERIAGYRKKHGRRIDAIVATQLKGMNADPDVDCVGEGDIFPLDIRLSNFDGKPLLKDLGDVYAKTAPSCPSSNDLRLFLLLKIGVSGSVWGLI